MNPLTNVRNVTKMNDRELELGYVNTNKSWHRQYKDSAWIFIGGLNFDLTEGDIICVFSQFGEVVNIDLIREPKTGKSRGFAFLCYEDQRSTVLAVDNLNGERVAGRITRVDHVENYKAPKVTGDDSGGAQKWEGCGPEVMMRLQPELVPKAAPEPVEEKKKKKKGKKEKKKKKKKKKKESSDSDSSESSSQAAEQPSSSRDPQNQIPRPSDAPSSSYKRSRLDDQHPEQTGTSRNRTSSPDRFPRERDLKYQRLDDRVRDSPREFRQRSPDRGQSSIVRRQIETSPDPRKRRESPYQARRRRESPSEVRRQRESPSEVRRQRESPSEVRRRRESPSEVRRHRESPRNYRGRSRERSRSPYGRRR